VNAPYRREHPETLPEDGANRFRGLHAAVEHAAHYLPTQGPIEVFVHHNTLHAWEEFPFHHSVAHAAALYGRQPYLSEDRYWEELTRGRILLEDLAAVLIEELDDEADQWVGPLGTRYQLRLAMLQHRLRICAGPELQWLLAETSALRHFPPETPLAVSQRMVDETKHWILRDFRNGTRCESADPDTNAVVSRLLFQFDKRSMDHWADTTWEAFTLHLLWEICQHAAKLNGQLDQYESTRSWSLATSTRANSEDGEKLVNDVLIRFCASFLDQGLSHWELPNRQAGFYRSFLELYRSSWSVDHQLRGLPAELERLHAAGLSPIESLRESLELLGISEAETEEFLRMQLLALPGWAGMIWQLETNAAWSGRPAPRGTLVEYLAIRLILQRVHTGCPVGAPCRSVASPARERSARTEPEPRQPMDHIERQAFLVFQLAQARGWSPHTLYRLSTREWEALCGEVESFSSLERRRVYHLAYERRYRNQALDAMLLHDRRDLSSGLHRMELGASRGPTFQLISCIDDREESFRRHLEEIEPQCQTFGAAGFFAVAMYYRGVADAHFRPLCPNVIQPRHYVQEEVNYSLVHSHRRRLETRRALGNASHRWHRHTRTVAGGVITSLLGSLASIPMVTRILFPRSTAQLRRHFGRIIQPPTITELSLQRIEDPPSVEHLGYTVDEMVEIVSKVLKDIGLLSVFSRLVFVTGHGSASLNNPHESAYNCGACSGGHGGANARAFCRMANHVEVRERLKEKDITLPSETHFVAGEHNTCDDSVVYFDLDQLPRSHIEDFEHAVRVIDEARRRNAHERCRRFESAALTLSFAEALQHVEARSEDLSQTRPEFNHATNALCVVGRRDRTRRLFLDRRAFLASYDPDQDDAAHSILERILHAVIPVCSGINLEYYFSTVDVAGYGCGSKLPHNITSLLGVMEGASSDLRPGLSAQMVEIHEPLRILFVIEATPDTLLAIMDRNEHLGRLIRNEWIQLAAWNPHGPSRVLGASKLASTNSADTEGMMQLFRQGRFEPYWPETAELPTVTSSLEWYRGWRGDLGFASIIPASEVTRAEAPWDGNETLGKVTLE
jgi:uncharacterized protein